ALRSLTSPVASLQGLDATRRCFFLGLTRHLCRIGRPRMKPLSRTIFTTAVAFCAAVLLTSSPAPGAEENFFQKFQPVDPCNWAGFYIGFNNGATFTHFNLGKQVTDVNLEQQFYELIPEATGDEVGFFTT